MQAPLAKDFQRSQVAAPSAEWPAASRVSNPSGNLLQAAAEVLPKFKQEADGLKGTMSLSYHVASLMESLIKCFEAVDFQHVGKVGSWTQFLLISTMRVTDYHTHLRMPGTASLLQGGLGMLEHVGRAYIGSCNEYLPEPSLASNSGRNAQWARTVCGAAPVHPLDAEGAPAKQ